jgi:uncharacterized membrane protein (DUF373 family)
MATVTKLVAQVEKVIVSVLLVLLVIALAAGTVQLVVTVIVDTTHRWTAVHTIDELAELRAVFSGFMLILIGLELMQTIVMYLADQAVHVEVVLTVAMIAAARHAIDIDYNNVGPGNLTGTAALIIGLAGAQYLYRRAGTFAAPDGTATRRAGKPTEPTPSSGP